jgi:pimeloyl-ACP methyl ester carboxylesterase
MDQLGMIFLAILLIVFIAFPYIMERSRLKMGEPSRADAPGDFCSLSKGLTHYRYFGPKTGPLVVCIHGLTTPSFVFEAIAKEFEAKGYRVLVYDHYGRGYSDRPSGVQDRQFFVEHLRELLDSLGEKDAFDLVGYSMGGAIASAFGAEHLDRIKKLILLAPAGMGHELGSLAKIAFRVPLFGNWAFMALYARLHRQVTEKERTLLSSVDYVVDRQQRELNYVGFLPSVLSSLRGILAISSRADHQRLAAHNIDIVAVWGAEDTVIPISGKEKLLNWNAGSRHIVIPHAGHGLAYTHVTEVMHDLSFH